MPKLIKVCNSLSKSYLIIGSIKPDVNALILNEFSNTIGSCPDLDEELSFSPGLI